ncbi:MAG: omp85 [Parachlamydiales bacterium]|nr:omp85 [Parachlamydiales bacterium]
MGQLFAAIFGNERNHMSKNTFLIRSTVVLSCLFASAAIPLSGAELYEEKKVSRIQVEYDSPESNTSFDPKPVLTKLKTKEGDDFSQFTFDNDLKSLSEEYDRVQPTLRVQDENLVITIRLTPRPIIHQIVFAGNERYSTGTLQKELEIKPYTIFNRQEFNKAFNKVKDYYIKKGYFESQLSYTIRPIENTNEIDIVIDVKEGKSGNIKKIVFKGFSKSEQSDLGDAIYLKKYNFFTSWLTGVGKFRDEALEQDKMTILNYLHNRGYADAAVDIQILDDPVSDKIIVDITANRGIQYHIGQVHVSGHSVLTTDEVMKRALVHEGDIFSPDKIRDSAQAMKDLYGQKGYIDASVQFETPLCENDPIFNVDFVIDEGQQYKIGLVHIFGNHSTKNNVILRESLLVPGETFDSRKLKATQQRLEAIGYFKTVNVYAVRTSDDAGLGDNYRDVYIEVEETTTGNVSLFMGFSSMDSIFGGLDLTERNFNIAGLGRALHGQMSSLRGGGQYFHARATLGKKEENILLSWMNPYVNDTLWRFGVELSQTFSELQSKNSRVSTYGGTVLLNYPLSVYWTAGVRDRLRHTQNSIKIHKPKDGEESKSYWEAKSRNQGKGFLSAISANIAYDSTDSSAKPHRGWRSYLEGEMAGVGGKFHFWKVSYLNSIYFPVTANSTFKIRGEARFITPYGEREPMKNVPYSERFFLGGESTVRGYKPSILGPKIHYTYTNEHGQQVEEFTQTPTGGFSSCLLSAEYNYSLLRMLDVFFFFDAGSVTLDTWSVHTLRCGTGAGVRLEINKGTPIVLGYGYAINPAHLDDRQKLFFSMGGQF